MEEIKFFFSYAREDSEFVLKLTKELRAVGANLWLDQLDILGGQRWDHAVEGALGTCQGMIAILSPESVASHNVMDEVSYALEEQKLVVPILFRSCAIPFRLRRVQYIDFTASYETGFSHLLRALRLDQPFPLLRPAAPEEAVAQDATVTSEEMAGQVPSLEQPLVRPEPPEPKRQINQKVETLRPATLARIFSLLSRRTFLGFSLLATLGVLTGTIIKLFPSLKGRLLRNPRFVQKPRAKPYTASLPSGFYRNQKSNIIHYVLPNRRIRKVRSIDERRLESWQIEGFKDVKFNGGKVHLQLSSASSSFEDAASRLISIGQPLEAIELLHSGHQFIHPSVEGL